MAFPRLIVLQIGNQCDGKKHYIELLVLVLVVDSEQDREIYALLRYRVMYSGMNAPSARGKALSF